MTGRSSVVFHMLDRIDDLIDQLQGDARDNTLRISERALQGAERDPRLLSGDAGEQLFHHAFVNTQASQIKLGDIPRRSPGGPLSQAWWCLAIHRRPAADH